MEIKNKKLNENYYYAMHFREKLIEISIQNVSFPVLQGLAKFD